MTRYYSRDDRIAKGTKYRDANGPVVVEMSYETFAGKHGGVIYLRDGKDYQLGNRRWERDFSLVPFIEATEDHPAFYREGKRLVAGKSKGKTPARRLPHGDPK